jgi:hypothetical protein
VSVLSGPNFDAPQPLVTGLPQPNTAHAVNGLQFDNNGDLLAAIGSDSNAGVKYPTMGDLPESPLSAAVIKARTSLPFHGALSYVLTASGAPTADQRRRVLLLAPGDAPQGALRNPYTSSTPRASSTPPTTAPTPATASPAPAA